MLSLTTVPTPNNYLDSGNTEFLYNLTTWKGELVIRGPLSLDLIGYTSIEVEPANHEEGPAKNGMEMEGYREI